MCFEQPPTTTTTTNNQANKRQKTGESGDGGLIVFMCGGDKLEGENEPVLVEGLRGESIKDLLCDAKDPQRCFVLTTRGEVKEWGSAPNRTKDEHKIRCITSGSLIRQSVALITSGSYHHAAITASGELYTWGQQLDGRWNGVPKQPQGLDGIRIQQVACGSLFTVALDRNGKVYSWGSNNGFGCTGHGALHGQHNDPRAIETGFGADSVVTRISACEKQVASAMQTGELYTWGSNQHGQLGHGDGQPRSVPTKVTSLQDKMVFQVSCGFLHTAAVTKEGALYTFGINTNGQLGHNDTHVRMSPTLVRSLEGVRINQVSCGEEHTAALTDKGVMYTWGNGEFGQLGHGSYASELQPKPVDKLKKYVVSRISACSVHTVAMVTPTSLGEGDLVPVTGALRSLINNPDPKYHDVAFEVENETFYGMRCILEQRCPYFKAMFQTGMQESKSTNSDKPIKLVGIRKQIFLLVLTYLYTDSISLTCEEAVVMYGAADMFGLELLQGICISTLENNLTTENAAQLLQAASETPHKELERVCVKFVLNNVAKVSQTAGFQHLSNPTLLREIVVKTNQS